MTGSQGLQGPRGNPGDIVRERSTPIDGMLFLGTPERHTFIVCTVLFRGQQGQVELPEQRGHGGPRETKVLRGARAVQGHQGRRGTAECLATADLQDRLVHLYVGFCVM